MATERDLIRSLERRLAAAEAQLSQLGRLANRGDVRSPRLCVTAESPSSHYEDFPAGHGDTGLWFPPSYPDTYPRLYYIRFVDADFDEAAFRPSPIPPRTFPSVDTTERQSESRFVAYQLGGQYLPPGTLCEAFFDNGRWWIHGSRVLHRTQASIAAGTYFAPSAGGLQLPISQVLACTQGFVPYADGLKVARRGVYQVGWHTNVTNILGGSATFYVVYGDYFWIPATTSTPGPFGATGLVTLQEGDVVRLLMKQSSAAITVDAIYLWLLEVP